MKSFARIAGNVANHLRHPPTQRLRRTRGYGGQDVKVLPIPVPIPIVNERKTAMKKMMMMAFFAAMVALVVEDTESHAFLREGVDLS